MPHLRPTSLGRLRRAAALLLVAGLALTGCSSGSGGGQDSDGSAGAESALTAVPTPSTAKPSGTVVRISVTGDSVDPTGSRVDVDKGKPVTLLITATKAGELHVHSTPEQHVEFPAGTSAATLTLDQPGVVDVEDHALDKLIVQLEVR